jgi:hypothetical protein
VPRKTHSFFTIQDFGPSLTTHLIKCRRLTPCNLSRAVPALPAHRHGAQSHGVRGRAPQTREFRACASHHRGFSVSKHTALACTGRRIPRRPQQQTTDRPDPAPHRPVSGMNGWMDGFRARLRPACRPVPSRILTPAGTPSPPTTPIALSTARPQTGNMHARLPRPHRPASPLSPPLRLHHPSPSRAKLRRQRASLIRSDRQIAGGAGP